MQRGNETLYKNWLIIYCFTAHSTIFHSYGDVTTAGERLQNFAQGLGSCLYRAKNAVVHGASSFPVSSEGLAPLVSFYDIQSDDEDLF
jgi:hypothetical protein